MTIPEAVVEVAAKAAYEAQMEDGDTEWAVFIGVNSSYLDYWRDQARAALEAAATHMECQRVHLVKAPKDESGW